MTKDAKFSDKALNSRLNQPQFVEHLAAFVVDHQFENFSDDVVQIAKLFLMDTIAVGVAATTYHATDKALQSVKPWGESKQARVVGRPGITLSAAAAAFVNGMQVHALEWDGLHEETVVIALCASVGALVAELDQTPSTGQELISAFVLGVEVAVFFGGITDSPPRFFRPSVAGGLGAVMALAKLRKLSQQQTIAALGLGYSQICGTMQAHWEGSMALPMQVGATARNAHFAVDMAQAGMTGPVDIIAGQFNYFALFENSTFNDATLSQLGKPYKITEVAHKPYPAGRATQAVLTMLQQWQDEQAFLVTDIASIEVRIPHLVMLLVGRPRESDMTASYARLCLRFIVPLMLLERDIDPRRFTQAVYDDAEIVTLSEKMTIVHDGNPDKNALGPQTMTVTLNDGKVLSLTCEDPLGSPNNPLNKDQRDSKVARCFELGLPEGDADQFITVCEDLENLSDCRQLLSLVT
ncbi:MAG: MmgE/PrpD family protein [Acidiferrobacterales bacterium]|nr:MmgE/PrpD family protein [Acidiferrobacterales bacterium]